MYSIDFIRRAVAYKDDGHTFAELKNTFKIPPETYYIWKKKLQNGYSGEKVFRERKRKIDKDLLKQKSDTPGKAGGLNCEPLKAVYFKNRLKAAMVVCSP